MIPHWVMQVIMLIITLIGVAVWHFYGDRHFHTALWLGLAGAVLLLLVVTLFLRNGIIGKQTRDELGDLLASGQELLRTAPLVDNADFERRVKALVESVKPHLSGADFAMFLDNSGMMTRMFSERDGYSPADDRVKNYLSFRLQRLREHLERIPPY